MKSKKWSIVAFILAVLVVLGGCGKPATQGEGPSEGQEVIETKTLVVGAAASLNESFTELGQLFEADNPEWKVEFNFASSGNLKTSIEQGAPMDVFASAAEKQMNALKDSGHIDSDTVKLMVKNELVFIAPKNSSLSSLDELPGLEKIAVGEPESVPAGQYAKESLTNLGLWDKLAGKLAFTKDVRQALFYVEQNEVDAGFVYATDAAKSDAVQVVMAMPEDSYASVLYPIGILASSENREGAEKWVEFVLSDKGQEVLSKYGFKTP